MSAVAPDNKTQVLVVAGHGIVRRRLEEGLTALGYQVFCAPDGEAALGILKQRRVDAVVASADLLGMNGIQLSRAVVRVHPHTPIIIMSQRPEPGQIAQALAGGASDLTSEMSTPEEMHELIERNIARKAAATRRIMTDRTEVLSKTIRALAAAIDAKSHYAARHSVRVTELCLLVGAKIGLSPQETATLELAAQLHDVGKIGTPDTILTKPDVLTDEEWVDVLKHPALGSAFLASVPELVEVASIVRHHHEHFDGTGYPDGLQGEAIPLQARIIAVADAYEAMTSERPYRQALTHEQAAEELMRHAGTQFDASMVHHLLAGLGEAQAERKAA